MLGRFIDHTVVEERYVPSELKFTSRLHWAAKLAYLASSFLAINTWRKSFLAPRKVVAPIVAVGVAFELRHPRGRRVLVISK